MNATHFGNQPIHPSVTPLGAIPFVPLSFLLRINAFSEELKSTNPIAPSTAFLTWCNAF
jgi:hypothetical protein